MRSFDQPKIASSWATVAPLLAALVAAAFRNPCALPGTPAALQASLNQLLKLSGVIADGVPGLAQALLGAAFLGSGLLSTTSGNITDDVILQYLQEHEPTGVSR